MTDTDPTRGPESDPDTRDAGVREAAAPADRDAEAAVLEAEADADGADGDDRTVGAQLGEELAFERPPIEPERPDPENALFVIVGALGTVALLASTFAPGLV